MLLDYISVYYFSDKRVMRQLTLDEYPLAIRNCLFVDLAPIG